MKQSAQKCAMTDSESTANPHSEAGTTETATPTSPFLPQELVEKIVKELCVRHDSSTLLEVARVSHALHAVARKHQFTRIAFDVWNAPESFEKFFTPLIETDADGEESKKPLPQLPSFVQGIRIFGSNPIWFMHYVPYALDLDFLRKILPKLPYLSSLILQNIALKTTCTIESLGEGTWEPVRDIQILDLDFDSYDVKTGPSLGWLVGLFSSIDDLCIACYRNQRVQVADFVFDHSGRNIAVEVAQLPPSKTPLEVKQVTLTCDYHLQELALYLRSVRKVEKAISFVIACHDEKDLRALNTLLHEPSAVKIRLLSILASPNLRLVNVSLADLTALEELRLSCGIYYNAPAPPRNNGDGIDAVANNGDAANANDGDAAPAQDNDGPHADDANVDAAAQIIDDVDHEIDPQPETIRTLHQFPFLWDILSRAPPSLKQVTLDIMATQTEVLESFSEPKGGLDWGRLEERLLALPNLEKVILKYRLADPAVKDEASVKVDARLMECMRKLRESGKVVVDVPAKAQIEHWSCH